MDVTSSFATNELVAGNHTPINDFDIEGWMSLQELDWLRNIAKDCEVIVEIGSYKGRSSKALADNCSGRIYCIDPWNGIYYNDDGSTNKYVQTNVYNDFYRNLENHILTKRVTPLKGFSHQFSFWRACDLVFIDGDHRYNEVLDDIKRAKDWLKDGGILAGHDYNVQDWPSVKRAVDESFNHVNTRDTIWWVQK